MKAAYFGSSARPLYGIHELPRAAVARSRSVLLCYPGVQEYNMAHWAFRRLSSMLAREGFHVMRFDWSGTGDSWGRTTDGSLERWLEDVGEAAQELRDTSGAESLSVVGMRLGAAIASMACDKASFAHDLVLWDPVVAGRQYVRELEEFDSKENMRLLHEVPATRDELAGFPFTPALRSSLATVDLRAQAPRGVRHVAIVASSSRPDHRELHEMLLRAQVEATYDCVPEDPAAGDGARNDSALLPTRTLAAITDRLSGRVPS